MSTRNDARDDREKLPTEGAQRLRKAAEDARVRADSNRENRPDLAGEMDGKAHRMEKEAAEIEATTDTQRYEAANAYSTTVDSPPGEEAAKPAAQPRQQGPKAQQQQTPRRVR